MKNPYFAQTTLHGLVPQLPPLPAGHASKERMEGALWGVAVGDALGYPYEGKSSREIAESYPFLPQYRLPVKEAAAEAQNGMYSDDTQMSIDIARCLMLRGYVNPKELLSLAGSYRICGAGPIVLMALYRFRFGDAWDTCGVYSPYNGGAMRAIPIGLYHGQDLEALFADAVVSCYATHTHPVAIASTLVMAYAAAYLSLCDRQKFMPNSFLDALIAVAGEVERAMPMPAGSKSLEAALRRVPEFLQDPLRGMSVLGCSVNAAESVSSAVLCFLCSSDDYLKTVKTAICGGGDTDSVASMAGGMCGALNGLSTIPGALMQALFEHRNFAEVAARFAQSCDH